MKINLTHPWRPFRHAMLVAGLLLVSACATNTPAHLTAQVPAPVAEDRHFEADRAAILAMAGDYKVTFDFQETVSFQKGYTPKERYKTGGHEMVRVIKDTGDFISLQHILVVGDGDKVPFMPIKHWRQDWQYEPATIMTFKGANTWQKQQLTEAERAGKWSQTVYQVDDAPRYAAVAAWDHTDGTSEWASPPSWRPLPRRDATKRSDYHAIEAVNRHALTPKGWVHEQDNSKLILTGDAPKLLVREIGVNTYNHFADLKTEVGTDYWAATEEFWAEIRDEWDTLMAENDTVALTVLGEPSELYMQILGIASDVADGKVPFAVAAREAVSILHDYVDTNPTAPVKRLQAQADEQATGGYSR
ncbi:DUF6607 family protein [Kordiimonas lacus]|uniref:Secreted protein n=1 Tax=Kordiimonas lacus TaxID=637679 RepID=A0A1G6ZM90_9PROT|nr:DUF6607 family protein [Kordiimonas lacus]SDE03944.1 hypothetical protein SAMN04488071_1881 [Kordiimonas lacus]